MSPSDLIEDGFFIEVETEPQVLGSQADPDRRLFAGEMVVVPLPETQWLEFAPLGLPGPPGPPGPSNFLILGLPGGPTEVPTDQPNAVVYRVRA